MRDADGTLGAMFSRPRRFALGDSWRCPMRHEPSASRVASINRMFVHDRRQDITVAHRQTRLQPARPTIAVCVFGWLALGGSDSFHATSHATERRAANYQDLLTS